MNAEDAQSVQCPMPDADHDLIEETDGKRQHGPTGCREDAMRTDMEDLVAGVGCRMLHQKNVRAVTATLKKQKRISHSRKKRNMS